MCIATTGSQPPCCRFAPPNLELTLPHNRCVCAQQEANAAAAPQKSAAELAAEEEAQVDLEIQDLAAGASKRRKREIKKVRGGLPHTGIPWAPQPTRVCNLTHCVPTINTCVPRSLQAREQHRKQLQRVAMGMAAQAVDPRGDPNLFSLDTFGSRKEMEDASEVRHPTRMS